MDIWVATEEAYKNGYEKGLSRWQTKYRLLYKLR